MSWDCPYWNNNICDLNGIECKPGKGQCILRHRFEIKSSKKPKNNQNNKSESVFPGTEDEQD